MPYGSDPMASPRGARTRSCARIRLDMSAICRLHKGFEYTRDLVEVCYFSMASIAVFGCLFLGPLTPSNRRVTQLQT
jgi:hypothetical protein